jgi:hypothetical protein
LAAYIVEASITYGLTNLAGKNFVQCRWSGKWIFITATGSSLCLTVPLISIASCRCGAVAASEALALY